MERAEAIKKIRQMSLPKETMEILEALAPELKESEDERIRKHIIEILNSLPGCYWYGQKEKDDTISYLEKQKDHFRDDAKMVEQKPAEWDEEDEKILERFLGWLQGSMGEKTYSLWLKSLRDRFNLQPKQEWSEEDEEIYNKALDAIYYKDLNDKDEVDDALKALCDLISRKRKVIPPYARWKPSEKQIEALEKIRNIFHVHHLWDEINPILYDYEELMRDLQKLL